MNSVRNGYALVGAALCLPLPLGAAPAGGSVESGQASIEQNGGQTEIHQSSDSATLQWQSFNLDAGESVQFNQPGSQSITLNQILDQNPSQIHGQISANGRVVLANPNGLIFGAGSTLNVGSLIATTANTELHGDELGLTPSGEDGFIDFQGEAQASGSLAFFAPDLDVSGRLEAGEDIHLSNHSEGIVTLADSGIGFAVTDSAEHRAWQQGLDVSGEVRSDGGYVELSTAAVDGLYDRALNMDGLVSADSLSGQGGEVALVASEGTTWVTGDISADGATAGGRVDLAGQRVGLIGDASVTAEGASGGGEVFIGGGWDYDTGPALADQVHLGEDSRISADATTAGEGGEVWIWSAERTRALGAISARGAGEGGDGGFVETSSRNVLDVTGAPDVGAEAGESGAWLLDPGDIYIDDYSDTNTNIGNDTPFEPDDDNQDSFLDIDTLVSAIQNNTNVTIETTTADGSIYLEHSLNVDSPGTLTLNADSNIELNAPINVPSTVLTLNAAGEINIDTGTTDDLIANALHFGADTLNTTGDLTIDARRVRFDDDLTWNAQGAIKFADNSVILGGNTADAVITFNMNSNDLRLASVGNGGVSDPAGLTLNNAGTLTLAGNIDLNGERPDQALDLSTADSIELDGITEIRTQGSDLSLAELTTGGDAADRLDIYTQGGNLALNGGGVKDDLFVNQAGEITLNGNLTANNVIDMEADQVLLNSTLTLAAGDYIDIDSDIDGAQDLTFDTDGSLYLWGGIGGNTALTTLTFDLADDQVIEGAPAIHANALTVNGSNIEWVMDDDTQVSTSSALDLQEVRLVGDGELTLSNPNNDIDLGAVSLGALTVEAGTLGTLDLHDDLDLDDHLDLRTDVTSLSLANDVVLTVNGSGGLLLADDVTGTHELVLTAGGGAVTLGDQAGGLESLTVDQPDGETRIGNITVDTLLDLSSAGSVTASADTRLEATAAAGEIRLGGADVDLDGHGLELAADHALLLGDIRAADLAASASDTDLNGSIETTGALDLSGAGPLTLSGDSDLTGELDLGAASINGPHALALNNLGTDLTLDDIGDSDALDSLAVTTNGTLSLDGVIETDGSDGILLAGDHLDLAGDTTFDTSASNGNIDLSGIGIDDAVTLTLNAGDGQISLGQTRLTSLVLEEMSGLRLGGDIETEDATLDLAGADSIELIGDVTLDTSATDAAIDLGDADINGTYELTLNGGAGELTFGPMGQNVALQSVDIRTDTELSLNAPIRVVGELTVDAADLTVSERLQSSGGTLDLSSAAAITLTPDSSLAAYDDIDLNAQSGDVALSQLTSEAGRVTVVAEDGDITNAMDDFVNLADTSVNITAADARLDASGALGLDADSPLVLDVAQSGVIDLTLGEPLAYVVNLGGARVRVSGGQVQDFAQGSSQATRQALSQVNDAGIAWAPEEGVEQLGPSDSPLFAVTQPGHTLPANVALEGNSISQGRPDVPALYFNGEEWEMRYPVRAQR